MTSRRATLRWHAAVATVAWLGDAFLCGGAGLGFLVAVGGAVAGLAKMVRGLLGDRTRIVTGAGVFGEYVGAVVLIGVVLGLQNEGATARAAPVIAALDAYHAAHGAYPRDLNELTPEYLSRVPRAKYTLWMSEYQFAPAVSERDDWLLFTALPPFGARYFDLETRRWADTD